MGDHAAAALTALLQAARRVEAGSRVLVTGPGCGEAAQWAVAQGARVTAWVDSVAEATTLTALRLPTLAVRLQADYAGLEPGTYDVALVLLDRGRLLQEEVLRVAAALLRPGGRLACVGATQEGVRGAVEFARIAGASTDQKGSASRAHDGLGTRLLLHSLLVSSAAWAARRALAATRARISAKMASCCAGDNWRKSSICGLGRVRMPARCRTSSSGRCKARAMAWQNSGPGFREPVKILDTVPEPSPDARANSRTPIPRVFNSSLNHSSKFMPVVYSRKHFQWEAYDK